MQSYTICGAVEGYILKREQTTFTGYRVDYSKVKLGISLLKPVQERRKE
jgi:hypothetical protein